MSTVTQHQIAAKAGVSRSTVSAVLSNSTIQISSAVRQKVLDVAASLNYRPNRYAQITRGGKSGLIGVITFGRQWHLSQRRTMSTAEAILEERYEPLVQESLWFERSGGDEGQAACQRMIDARVEGVVLLTPSALFKQSLLDGLLKTGMPVVAIGGDHLRGIPRFVSDREWGYEQIARHLLRLGHRRLAILAKRTSSYIKQGVTRALTTEGGLPPEVFHPELPPSAEPLRQPLEDQLLGLAGMEHLLAGAVRPDAVICCNDDWAMGAMTACAEAKLAVPEQIALTGFDDAPGSRFGMVPLTTIAQPVAEISARAVACLLEMIRSGKQPETPKTKVRGRLVVRRSCGAT